MSIDHEKLIKMSKGHTMSGSSLRRPMIPGCTFLVKGRYSLEGTWYRDIQFITSGKPEQHPLL